MKYQVLPAGHFDQDYAYESSLSLERGDIVKIPVRNREILGVVIKEDSDFNEANIKSIIIKYPFKLPNSYLELIDWVAKYTMYPRGQILKMVLCEPSLFKAKKIVYPDKVKFIFSDINLLNQQQDIFIKLLEYKESTTLLHGVTGAGKTEVYLKYAQNIVEDNKQVLILLPEIALMSQMSNRIEKYFGVKPFIWNSNITPKNRKKIWLAAHSGDPCLVIGTRSALFLPFKNLGLIVVDEEHDSSYKQNDGVLYNARDMAVVLGKISHIPVILSSATPSLESYVNSKSGKYNYLTLDFRFADISMPNIEIIDMKQNGKLDLISKELALNMNKSLEKNEQVMLYLNRRGYAPIVICKKCGEKFSCPNCSAFLVMHKNSDTLNCHICGYSQKISQKCHHCNNDEFISFGAGTEKLYEEVSLKFPSYKTIIASSDTMNSQKNIDEVISSIKNNEVNIIISTQILAKGHHFSNLSTIGIIDGDFGLDMADIRAIEKNYQLLYQVLGRAGREVNNGKVFIQTFTPQNQLFGVLKNYDQYKFFEDEIQIREEYRNPPFYRMIAIIISGNNAKNVEAAANQIARINLQNSILLGPVQAPISKIRGKTRWRILVKSSKKNNVQQDLYNALKSIKFSSGVNVQIDVDPINFL